MTTQESLPQGFTLLEMLVVLVLVGLTSVLLVQGLSHALTLRERVLEHTEAQREQALRKAWFLDSVSSLTADLERFSERQFSGGPDGFQGLSLGALKKPAGRPTLITWGVELQDGVIHLTYSEDYGPGSTLWSWRAPAASFSYYDPETGWHDHWPPRRLGLELPPLPAAIAFETDWRGSPRFWLASVRGSRDIRTDLEPLDGLL